MCGIAGCVVASAQSVDPECLRRMAAALQHRGPDDAGFEVLGSVGLVHTRLAIVDPTPAGHQPMEHPNGWWWLTYNGEIFNHAELRRQLPRADYRGHSDTETMLHALAEWGENAIPRCNGLFAYAALDLRNRRLLLVRDRFGVKPLYYTRHDGALYFASEMAALFAAGVPRQARRDVLAQAIVHGWANGPLTPIDAVQRVLPGTLLEVDLDTLAVGEKRWYDPADVVDRERMAALAARGRGELADLVEEALRESVRRRLMADVPVGTMCSGGIDSSLVTAYAHAEGLEVVAYNAAVTDQPRADESPWAERVARHLGIELRTVPMTAASWRRDLVEVVRHNEYPLIHESSVPMMQIAGLARDDGVKVLLSGEGADELFGGYGFLSQRDYLGYLRANRRYGSLAGLVLAKARRDGLVRAGRKALQLGVGSFRKGGDTVGTGVEDPGLSVWLDGGPFPGPNPSAVATQFETDVMHRAGRAYEFAEETRRPLEVEFLKELGTYLPHLLNRQDKSTMQRSIETRVPFLDPDLVALALNLPLEARIEPLRKGVLRDIGYRHLPKSVVRRPKIGFGFDVRGYLEPAARPEFLGDGHLRQVLGVAREPWSEAIADADAAQALRLWSGEIWCRTVLEGQATPDVEAALWR